MELSDNDHQVSVDQTRDYVAMCSVHIQEQLTEIQNRSCPWTRFNKCFYYFPVHNAVPQLSEGSQIKYLAE